MTHLIAEWLKAKTDLDFVKKEELCLRTKLLEIYIAEENRNGTIVVPVPQAKYELTFTFPKTIAVCASSNEELIAHLQAAVSQHFIIPAALLSWKPVISKPHYDALSDEVKAFLSGSIEERAGLVQLKSKVRK